MIQFFTGLILGGVFGFLIMAMVYADEEGSE